MPSPFAAWTLDDIRKAILRGIDIAQVTVNRRLVEGDHWLDGDGWVGPRPDPMDEGYDSTMLLLENGFVSKNVIAEVCERHMTGICGSEPQWAFVPARSMAPLEQPSDSENSLIEEVEAALTRWVNKRRFHMVLQDGTVVLLWASRACFRLMVPAGLIQTVTPRLTGASPSDVETDDDGNPVQVTVVGASELDEALDMIYPQFLEPEIAAVVVDPETMREAGVFAAVDQETGKWEGELVYLEDDGMTTIRPIVDGEVQAGIPINLGKRLSFFEMRRKLLITQQVVQQQKALNLATSCIPRTVVTAGFLERVLLNAQMPGEWERDGDGNPIRFIPAKYVTGGGASQFVQGIEVGRDPQTGEVKLTTPQIQWREPGQVLMPVQAKEAHYRDILDECDQTHVLSETAATPSGVSREQARAGYEKSLQLTQPEIQNAVVWTMETTLALAEYLINAPGRWTGQLRCVCDARIDSGPVTPDQERAVAETIEKGLMSEETGMARLRIADVDAERIRIMRQPGSKLGLLKRQAEVMGALKTAGIATEEAAELVGLSDEQMAIVAKGVKKQEEKAAEIAGQQADGDVADEEPVDQTV